LWWNGLRSGARLADNAAAALLALIGAALSIAMVVALSWVAHVGFAADDPDALRVALVIVFWMIGFFAVVLPLFFGARQSVPVDRLVVYPFSISGLYRISLVASFASGTHLFWYPTLVAVTVVALATHRAQPLAWLAILAAFVICLVVWCHAVLLAVQHVLRRRSLRELMALITLVVVVLLSMVPALVGSEIDEASFDNFSLPASGVAAVARVASVFPPSVAVAGVVAAENDEPGAAAAWLGALVLWTVAGALLGERVFRKTIYGRGDGGTSELRTGARPSPMSRLRVVARLVPVPAVSGAVAWRELLYLLRSVPGRFSIVVVPILVALVGSVMARDMTGQVLGLDRSSLLFLGIMVYCSMFAHNFIYNAYAWEGAGIRSYFITPATPRQVVFGKNLGVWLFNLILMFECIASYFVIIGPPHPSAFLSGCMGFAAALLAATTAGNFVSPALPVARDISKVTNSPSQTGILVSLGMLVVIATLIGGLAAIGAMSTTPWLLPLLLAVLVALLGFGYRWLLGPASRLLEERRESLVEAVQIKG
jgi:hypothetical protein